MVGRRLAFGHVMAYAAGMVVIAAHLGWQALRFDIARPEISFRLFLANILTGALLAVAAFAGTF